MASETEKCTICLDDFKHPRLLPCIHSFCLKCLEDYCKEKQPGDSVPCPCCETAFAIPAKGVADLPHVKKETPPAIGEATREQGGGRYCDNHDDERIKIYCFDCNTNVCSMCCLETHRDHKFERIEKVAEQFSKPIDDEIKQVTARIECLRGVAAQVEEKNSRMANNNKAVRHEVKKRTKEIKELVDSQGKVITHELKSQKSAVEAEIRSHADAVQSALSEMERFRTSSLELMSKGSPVDITEAASNILARAKELLHTHVIPSEYHAPSYKFTPVDTDKMLKNGQNFVGHVVQAEDAAGTVMKKISTDSDGVLGVTSVDDELFVLLRRDVDQVAVYSINYYQPLRHLNVPDLKANNSNDMTSCERHTCLHMSDNDSKCIHRFDLSSSAVTKWSVPGSPCGLSVTPNCNLLVTCGGQTHKLVELSADSGQCVREITLQSDIKGPCHGIKLATGQFVVCHGGGDDHLHRVCVVDNRGKVKRSYGSDRSRLNCSSHLAVVKDSQVIFVVDWGNQRVVKLSSTLELIEEYSEELSCPWRLLHHVARRLYVGQLDGSVVVIQL